jgi:hypothetical protein
LLDRRRLYFFEHKQEIKMRTKITVPRSGTALSVLLKGLVLAAGAQCAFAAPASQPAQTGLLQLSNVKIQAATPQQIEALAASQKASSKTDARAHKDHEGSELREQTPEEMIAAGAASVARSAAPSGVVVPTFKGGTAVLLDESFMSNAVVTKDASGNLQMDCVVGPNAAKQALVNGKTVKGHGHDH